MGHQCGSFESAVVDVSPGRGCYVSMSCWLSKEPGPRGSGAPVRFRRECPDACCLVWGSQKVLGQPLLLREDPLQSSLREAGLQAVEVPPFPLEHRGPGLPLGPCVSRGVLFVTHFVLGSVS